jgi:hypothetical protein
MRNLAGMSWVLYRQVETYKAFASQGELTLSKHLTTFNEPKGGGKFAGISGYSPLLF